MAKSTTLRKSDRDEPVSGAPVKERAKPRSFGDSPAARLARARTANEIAKVIGLRPIKGRSGPKIAY